MTQSLLRKIKIGNVEINNNVFLAPMAGITDRPFRIICKEYGAGLVCTEMISSKGLYYKDDKTNLLLNMKEEKRPIAVQIFGNDIKAMEYAANYVSKIADIIDINMGCPAPKIVKNGDGSKLLLDLKKVKEIVSSVVKASKVPVTVKIRKGWDNDNIVAVQAAQIIEEAGASAITVHGRTRSQFYSGEADWDIIKQVKQSVHIPVIGNGDIKCGEDAKKIIEQTGVDGIMIGRAALGNPWIFEDIEEYLRNGKNSKEIMPQDKLKVILKHLNLEIEEKGERVAVREMRKHICWYIKNLKEATKLREHINKIENRQELEKCLIEYFENI